LHLAINLQISTTSLKEIEQAESIGSATGSSRISSAGLVAGACGNRGTRVVNSVTTEALVPKLSTSILVTGSSTGILTLLVGVTGDVERVAESAGESSVRIAAKVHPSRDSSEELNGIAATACQGAVTRTSNVAALGLDEVLLRS
jgi:hypothetical protein